MARQATFALNVHKFAEKSKNRATSVVKKLGIQIVESLVMGTPVDTGHARHNWQVGFGAPQKGEIAGTDQGGTGTVAKLQGEIKSSAKFGTTMYLSNSVPYIIKLEYGHSKQAPAGMVRITVARFQTFVDTAVAQAKSEFK